MSGRYKTSMVVRIPKDLVVRAKERKMNFSKTVRVALKAALAEAAKNQHEKNVPVTVDIPREMRDRAKVLGVCIASAARKAVEEELRLGEA